jgi:tetratricopeptide (TPR) repeat protein
LIGQIQDKTKSRNQYLPLLEQAHNEDPNDSQICFWLARDLMYAGLNERSAEKYLTYLDLPTSKWRDERAEAMRYLARVQPERKHEWLQKSLNEAPLRRELWLDIAEFYHSELDWLNLFWACVNGIERTQRTGSYLDDPSSWGYRLYDLGALACSHLGLVDRAVEWGNIALNFIPDDRRLASNLAYYHRQVPHVRTVNARPDRFTDSHIAGGEDSGRATPPDGLSVQE